MSTNTELSRIFEEMAAVLEITGANPFRVNAHRRVSRALKDLTTDVATLAGEPAKLTAIEGIGKSSAAKIIEYVETGSVPEHDELLATIPTGLIEVLDLPGLGPKTVKLLWEEAGVEDTASLLKAIDAGRLEGVPRMGAKTIQNIRESIAFAKKSSGRTRLGKARPIAAAIVEHLEGAVEGVERIAYAGSLRRGCETIGDIDVLAVATDPDALAERFRAMPGVEKVLVGGVTKSSVRLELGIQVDLRIVEKDQWGAALLYFTGSKQHNVRLREMAIRKGLRLNEYGLYPEDDPDAEEPPQARGIAPVASKTEESIYAALGLPWIPPELREDRGEFDREPPANLLETSDVRAELHAHTTASDGRLELEALVAEAKSRGFHTIAVTDHSKSSAQANGLDEERLREHVKAIRAYDAKVKGIRVLAGAEVDILSDGRLDYDDETLAMLDWVVASPHVALGQDASKATERLLRAIEHPLVHVIGHPTGRVINRREGLALDLDTIIAAAVEHDTALEINANPMRLDLRDTHVRAAVEAGALVAVDTDAHRAEDFDHLDYGVTTGRRGWLTKEQCINAWSAKKLEAWRKKKRS